MESDPNGFQLPQANHRLSHGSSRPSTITLEVGIDGNGFWVKYKSFKVLEDEFIRHDFPAAFSACWVRAVSDTDTSATVQFDY